MAEGKLDLLASKSSDQFGTPIVLWIGSASKSFSDSSLGGVSDQLPCGDQVERYKLRKNMDFGLSVLIAMKATFLLLAFAYLRTLGFTLLSLPLLYASLVSMLLSIASHPLLNLPMLLGKNPDGTFPIWSLIMFSPYLYFVRGFSVLQRLWSGEAPHSEICEGLYVRGWPYSPEKLPPGNPAIVDCTCELPRNLEFSGHAYLCIPTWDTRAPQPCEIESAVCWACRKRAQKIPIFIYCAYDCSFDFVMLMLFVTITPEVASRNVNRAIMAELVKLYKGSDLEKRLPSRNLSLSLSLSNESEF
ncbi:hypothetical protein HYC85_004708 [Camellia sinensis]|uniref:Uncharacterized protein n=1 Tax=Camellia sinensis TaxID=4442 RepID=A0A7J7HXA0_CAMSI|nr:hypothetical protein HYC85_004708 [Camellia sinensis]